MKEALDWIEMRATPHVFGIGSANVLACVREAEGVLVAEAFVIVRHWFHGKFDLTFLEIAASEPAGVFAEAGLTFDAPFVGERAIEAAREFLQNEYGRAAAEAGHAEALREWELKPTAWQAQLCRLKLDGAPPHLLQILAQTTRSARVRQFAQALAAASQPFIVLHEPTRRSFGNVWRAPPTAPPSESI
jgi:hypothetical protein